MMNFCRKSVHSLLGLYNSTDHHDDNQRDLINPRAIWSQGLISLVTTTPSNDTVHRSSPNVLESTSAIINPKPPPPPPRKDPGWIGFLDDIGGGVNGLMSCTESLGFESSDERRADDADADAEPRSLRLSERLSSRRRSRTAEGRKFPPPLPSLNRNGQPSFFLRPMRKDGRLELTEVRINRPEILRAYRGDGRLRLHLIRHDNDDDNENDDNCIQEEPEQEQDSDSLFEEKEEERNDVVSAAAGGGGEEWRFPASSNGGGEGSFWRCQQNLQLHHHGVWRQHQARRLHVAV